MAKNLMTGNEAVARGLYEAGVAFASAYPGTPSTEILENVAEKYKDSIACEWAPNEKVAFEAAVGASIVGGDEARRPERRGGPAADLCLHRRQRRHVLRFGGRPRTALLAE